MHILKILNILQGSEFRWWYKLMLRVGNNYICQQNYLSVQLIKQSLVWYV